jgi:hypothetical protein
MIHLNVMKENNQLIKLDGIQLRPRSEFKNEEEFLNQFPRSASPRLTKRLFMQLPNGFCVYSSGLSSKDFFVVLASEGKRATQWETVPQIARQKRCDIFRFKADYDDMMAEIERQLLAMMAGTFRKSTVMAGINVHPRSEFKSEDAFLNQFPIYTKTKLTKRLFMQLPAGLCIHSFSFTGEDFFAVLASEGERAPQWKTVPMKLRQKPCGIFRFKADYDNMIKESERMRLAMEAGTFGNTKYLDEGPPISDDVPF